MPGKSFLDLKTNLLSPLNGFTRSNMQLMEALITINKYLWQEVFLKRTESIIKKHLLQKLVILPLDHLSL